MSSTDRCVETIMQASGGKLTREDAEDKLESVMARSDRYKARGMNDADAFKQAATDQLTWESIREAKMRAAKLMNLQKRVDAVNTTIADATTFQKQRGAKEVGGQDIFNAGRAILNGVNTIVDKGRLGVQQMIQAYENRLSGSFLNEMTQKNLLKSAQSGKLDYEIAQELHELRLGDSGQPGISKNKTAQNIAEVFNKYGKVAVKNLNDQGAWISELMGYIAHNEHDWEKISNAGDSWKEDLLGNDVKKGWLDKDLTLAGMDKQEQDAFLNNVRNSLVSGEHFTGTVGFKAPAFTGPRNMAKAASQERLLHFDGADGWYNYWKKYGSSDTLLESILKSYKSSARTSGLMRVFGTNYPAEFDAFLSRLAQHYTDSGSPEAAREFKEKYAPALQRRWDELNGTMDKPVNQLAANIGASVRLFENVTKLGRVIFAHTSVPVTKAAAASQWGMSMLDSYKESLGAMFTKGGAMSADDKQLLNLIGAFNDGAIAHLAGAYGQDFSGRVSSINNTYMRLTGLPQFMNWQRISAQRGLSRFLGDGLDKDFGELHPGTQANLSTYGIDKGIWDLLRKADSPTTFEGGKYLTPDMAQRTDSDSIEAILRAKGQLSDKATPIQVERSVARFRDDLGLKLTAMYSEESRRALNIPGGETRAILMRTAQRGTLAGEMQRAIMQFKQWPTELILNTFGRTAYSSQTTGQVAFGMMHLMGMLTAAGYLRLALNDITSGREISDPTSPKVLQEAFISGGGGIVFGDTIAAAARQRDYLGVVESLMGPSLGSATEAGHHLWDAAHGKPVMGQVEKQLPYQIPLQNLYWLNLLHHYMFQHVFQSMIHPGWDDRYNTIGAAPATKPVMISH